LITGGNARRLILAPENNRRFPAPSFRIRSARGIHFVNPRR
jgi:hypothetical protein